MERKDKTFGAAVESGMVAVAKWLCPDVEVCFHDKMVASADLKKRRVHLPRHGAASGCPKEATDILRCVTVHEVGHQLYTTDLGERTPRGAKFAVLNGVEDIREERLTEKKADGIPGILRKGNEIFNRKNGERFAKGERPSPKMEAVLGMMLRVNGMAPSWKLSDKAAKLVELAYDEFSKVREARNTEESLVITEAIWKLWKDAEKAEKEADKGEGEGEPKPEKGDKDEAGDEAGEGDGEGSESEDGDKDGESDGSKSGKGDESDEAGEGDGEDGEGDESDGESAGSGEGEEDGDKDSKTGKRKPGDGGQSDDGEDEGEFEEDWTKGETLRKAAEEAMKDFVDENPDPYVAKTENDLHLRAEVTAKSCEEYTRLLAEVNGVAQGLGCSLDQVLRAKAACRKEPYIRRGKLDMKRLVPLALGTSKDVFYRVAPGEKLDTAVVLLLDESGSMSGKIENYRKAVVAVAEALSRMNIPFMLVGSSTRGRTRSDGPYTRWLPMTFHHYKDFNEQWEVVRSRVMDVRAREENVDGEFVEFGAKMLAQRKEVRKILFSFSDGQPCAGQGNNGRMCLHLSEVVKRTRKSGMEVYAFEIGTREPERFYGKEHTVYVENASKMDSEFIRKLAQIVGDGKLRF